MIRAMALYPNQDPKVIQIDPDEVMDYLGAPSEVVWPLELEVGIVRLVKPSQNHVNRCVCNTYGKVVLELRGPLLVVGTHGEEGFNDLTDDEVRILWRQFMV